MAAINKDEIFVGRKVYLKPSEYHLEDYGGQELVETEVSWVGNNRFKVKGDRNDIVSYNLHNLLEYKRRVNSCQILLAPPGEEDIAFERKQKLLIKIRKHFNSRAAFNEEESTLEKVIELLKL